jgi:hypothetical protein
VLEALESLSQQHTHIDMLNIAGAAGGGVDNRGGVRCPGPTGCNRPNSEGSEQSIQIVRVLMSTLQNENEKECITLLAVRHVKK